MSYRPPKLFFNAHIETIYPSLFRRMAFTYSKRERISTNDDDFLDLDWIENGSEKVAIISHGLEGNSTRGYVVGMAKAFASIGYDVIAWNYRGCSGAINKQLRFYHSGATEDFDLVIQNAVSSKRYKEIFLIGFSLGGNLTLKYLGERKANPIIKRAIVFSVPLDLHSSCIKISSPSNWVYANRFLRSLKHKVKAKSLAYKEIDVTHLNKVNSLIQFDDRYTAPLHGFENAIDYYMKCSSIHFLSSIQIPTLIINAKNDPFLGAECFPVEMLKDHTSVVLETPERGGHVGFTAFNKNGLYWSELRALEFITAK